MGTVTVSVRLLLCARATVGGSVCGCVRVCGRMCYVEDRRMSGVRGGSLRRWSTDGGTLEGVHGTTVHVLCVCR